MRKPSLHMHVRNTKAQISSDTARAGLQLCFHCLVICSVIALSFKPLASDYSCSTPDCA